MKSLSILFLTTIALVYCEEFSVAVQGTFTCHGKPYPDASVQLKEKDWVWDDVLDTTISAVSGFYQVQGHKEDWWYIEPYLEISHKCPNEWKQACKRTMIRNIPREAVVEGTVIRRYYGMDLELGNSYNGESKEC